MTTKNFLHLLWTSRFRIYRNKQRKGQANTLANEKNNEKIIPKDKLLKISFSVILTFIVYFLMQLLFLNDPYFDTDEGDIVAGGMSIANGLHLYSGYYSQHMPVSYYISALFWKLGAHTIYSQRISFYLFFALMWTIIRYRYNNIVSAKALTIFPFIFCSVIPLYSMGTSILSEHFAGIGFVVLLLEYWKYLKDDSKLTWDSCLLLSLSILLSFGTIFVGAFGVFCIGLSVLISEIASHKKRELKFGDRLKYMLKKFIPLFIWCAAPWLILIIYYIANNELQIAFFSMYTINREIYSKYLGGFGSNVGAAILATIDCIFGYIHSMFPLSNMSASSVIFFLIFLLAVIFVIDFFKKNGTIQGVLLCGFIFSLCTRGIYSFHATHWVEVMCLLASIAIFDIVIDVSKKFSECSFKSQIMAVLLIMTISSGYLSRFSQITRISTEVILDPNSQIITAITDEKEPVWQLQLATSSFFIGVNRPATSNVGAVPWLWEGFGKQTLDKWNGRPPRVAIFMPEAEIWGYKTADYASELIEYMNKYYYNILYTSIWVRKDYYSEASNKSDISAVIYQTKADAPIVTGFMENNAVYEQHFNLDTESFNEIKGVQIYTATYARINNSSLNIQLISGNNVIAETIVNTETFTDNSFETIMFNEPAITSDSDTELVLKITAFNVNDDLSNAITLAKNSDTDQVKDYLLINNAMQEGDLLFKLIA